MTRTTPATRRTLVPLLFSLALMLMGCKEVLYSSLTEFEANEMVAILDASGIEAQRERDKDGNYALKVETDLIASAVTVLRNAGYPQQRFKTLGDVFANEGLVGTPFEERARFMHALNEELSRTISAIDGVRTARVQVMIPTPEKYAKEAPTATASVAILFERNYDLTPMVPSIKTLVAHSVPDLDYDDVAIGLFPVDVPVVAALPPGRDAPKVTAMGVVSIGTQDQLIWAIAGLMSVVAFCVMVAVRRRGSHS